MKTAEEFAKALGFSVEEFALVERIQRESRRGGAEEMRERCAAHADIWGGRHIGAGIRGLALPGDVEEEVVVAGLADPVQG